MTLETKIKERRRLEQELASYLTCTANLQALVWEIRQDGAFFARLVKKHKKRLEARGMIT